MDSQETQGVRLTPAAKYGFFSSLRGARQMLKDAWDEAEVLSADPNFKLSMDDKAERNILIVEMRQMLEKIEKR